MEFARIQYYLVTLSPRFALAIVFLWFGLDKFIIHEFYLNWLQATERVKSILPTQDLGLSIYAIGVVEIVIASLLFIGVKIRLTSIVAVTVMIIIMLTAQYPSSFPQDIGLIGVGLMLAVSRMKNNKNNTKNNNSLDNLSKRNVIRKSRHIESNLHIARYSITAVLFLWALDYILNHTRHIGWLQLSSAISEFLFSVSQVMYLIVVVAVIEIVLALVISIGRRIIIMKYAYIVSTAFFIFVVLALDPPSNNHQTVGLAIITAWLGYLAFTKKIV